MRVQLRWFFRRGVMMITLAGGMLAGTIGLAAAQPVAMTTINPALIVWKPLVSYEALTLSVSMPDGEVISHDFTGNQPVTLSAPSEDGTYTYELRVTPVIDAGVKRTLAAARKQGKDEAVARDFRKRKLIPSEELIQSGSFSVVRGTLVVPSVEE